MDIKGYLSRLFKTKELGMISLNDMAYIPTRNELNSELIESLDEYKEQYKEVLLQDKYITSHDISCKDYSDDMIMNFYLFNRLIINQDELYNLDTIEEYKRNELFLKYKINPYKILLYIRKIEEIYNETLLRLIALKEIVNELELDKNKIDAIKNEIDTLTTHYMIFKNNLYASLMEINNLKNNVNHQFDKYNENASNLLVKAYYNRLKKYYEVLMPDKFEEIDKEDLPLINKLANLELELEIYCYKYIDVNKLNEVLQEIDKVDKTSENRNSLLQRINELALRYEVLNRYGGYELDLKPLYEVKFDILTIDIVKQEDSPFKSIDNKREMKYYEDIIANMITTYITGVDSILNNQLDENDKDIIECFIEILKNNGKFDFNNVLMGKIKLCLLLNVFDSNKILELFDNTIISKIGYNQYENMRIRVNRHGISLGNNVPLSTLCKIINFEINCGLDHTCDYVLMPFAKIYNYYAGKQEAKDEDIYIVPEGITKIDCMYLRNAINDDALEYLKSKINGKTIIMPSTLKEIFAISDMFEKFSIPKIVLNEGFENIYDHFPFICNDLKSITIPSTVGVMSFYCFKAMPDYCNSYETVNKFIFTNFENSLLLNDEIERQSLLESIFWMLCHDLRNAYNFLHEKSAISTVSQAGIMLRKIILEGSIRYMWIYLNDEIETKFFINVKDIFISNLTKIKYDNGMNFEELILNDLNIDDRIVMKLIRQSCIDANKKIDELFAQYKEQKESRHKM